MNKTIFLLAAISLPFFSIAQKTNSSVSRTAAIKWAPTGLLVGSASFQGEYNLGKKNSFTAKIGLPVTAQHSFEYEDRDAHFDLKATSFMAGYRHYLSKKRMSGFYIEPFLKYVHHTSTGEGTGELDMQQVSFGFNNEYTGYGVGAQLGVQFMIGKRLVIDLFFLGPEINSAENNFRAIESTNTFPWDDIQAAEAEQDIRDFIDMVPFLSNRTKIVVDKNNRTVMADFKGALPGIRTGISFGIAF